ncbi:diacylglycerol kinase family protein [Algoriphagus sp.]|uniref:diacylglycerol/lipid kinase family protein n=1 Tax=Algoriphagus sp. TaxID=1872435 RepID=UPI0025FE3CC2|nr:diacylglycerol kinase family protein [Algoriphagus sp.]
MKKVCLFIFNPVSGDSTIDKEELDEIVRVKLAHFETSIFETTGSDDTVKIKSEYVRLKPDLVLIGGGDGTVKLVAKSLINTNIPFCIVPFGSANGLAKCLGIHTVEDSWEAVRDYVVHPIDAIRINDELCLHLADFGFNANLVKNFEATDGRGMLAYIKSSVSEIFTTESKSFKLKIDGEMKQVMAKMLVLANGDQYGTGALINYKGKMNDGKFEVIALNPESAKDYIRMIMAMFRGDLEEQNSSIFYRCESCEIENVKEVEFQIDGELMGKPQSINATIEKQVFQFITSKRFSSSQKNLS